MTESAARGKLIQARALGARVLAVRGTFDQALTAARGLGETEAGHRRGVGCKKAAAHAAGNSGPGHLAERRAEDQHPGATLGVQAPVHVADIPGRNHRFDPEDPGSAPLPGGTFRPPRRTSGGDAVTATPRRRRWP